MTNVDAVGTVFLSFMSLCLVAGLWCTLEIAADPTGEGDTWILGRFYRWLKGIPEAE